MHRIAWLATVVALTLALGCGDAALAPAGPRGSVAVSFGALSLPGVADACYRLTIDNGASPTPQQVAQVTLSASRYGAQGSASYVAPCDASDGASLNTVRLDVLGIYPATVADCDAAPESLQFQDPGPLSREIQCQPNEDASVTFDVALMRPAQQGFFDVAVSFADVFCSAKLSCCLPDGAGGCLSDLNLLHNGAGTRASTVVLGLACAGATASGADVRLYLDNIAVDCGLGFGNITTVVPTGRGNLCDLQAGTCDGVADPLDLLYQAQVSRGEDAGAGGSIAYWNVALGVNKGNLPAGQQCVLSARATADDHAATGGAQGGVVAPGAVYPVITWQANLTDVAGLPWGCSEHGLAASGPVSAGYTDGAASAPTQLRNCFDPGGACCTSTAGCPTGTVCAADGVTCESVATVETATQRADCSAHAAAGETVPGVYLVDAPGGGSMPVWCDMNELGGWTLVMRGYGGDNAGWFTSAELLSAESPSPTMTSSFKLSDAAINALRGFGVYRLEFNGTASPPTIPPPTRYVSPNCTYVHTEAASVACRTWSASPDMSDPQVSATNPFRRGIVVGDPSQVVNYLSYLTNFAGETEADTGWYGSNVASSADWCLPGTSGCNFAMYVRSSSPFATDTVRSDCTAHYAAGETESGLYRVDAGLGTPFLVYCDMTDGGWTLVMRGYGAQESGWQTTADLAGTQSPSPTMGESYKVSDTKINALRGGGVYRLSFNGTASPPTVAPPTLYVSGACTYAHLAEVTTACRTWSFASDLSSPNVSGTNASRRGIVAGATATSGLIHYLSNFVSGTPGLTGWYAGNVQVSSDWCVPSDPSCDIVMFVRHD